MPRFNKSKMFFYVIGFFLVIGLISFFLGKGIIQGRQPTLYSFCIINFAGYLFFLLLPVEALIPYFLSVGYSGSLLIFLAISTAMVAQMFDYCVGFSVSQGFIDNFVGERRYLRAKDLLKKYGCWTIFLFNLSPFSSPIVVLASGALRFSFKKVIFYSFLGLLVKYSLFVFALEFIL